MPRRGKSTRIRFVGGEMTFSFADPQKVEFRQAIQHYGEAARDFSPALQEYLAYQLRSIDRNFRAEGRPQRWAALKPGTVLDRLHEGYGAGPILQRSGKLRRGFKGDVGKRTLRIRNSVRYFPYHQYGAPKANIPARPMIVLLSQDKAMFTRIMRRHLRMTP